MIIKSKIIIKWHDFILYIFLRANKLLYSFNISSLILFKMKNYPYKIALFSYSANNFFVIKNLIETLNLLIRRKFSKIVFLIKKFFHEISIHVIY